MKTRAKRIFKVLSSFAVIAMVLIVTVAMPVLAAGNGIYKLSDYIVDINSDGNEISVHYEIDGDQVIRAFYQDGTSTLHGSHHIYSPSSTETKINFRIYPLGTQKTEGADMTTGSLDISDVKSLSYLRMSSQFYFKMDFWSNFNDGYTDTSGYTNAFWYIFCYDSNGKYLQTVKSAPIVTTIHVDTTSIEFWPLRTTVFIDLPAGTKYITPSMLIGTYLPTDSASVQKLEVYAQPFRLTVYKDALVEQSLSSQRVEQALIDINQSIDQGNQHIVDKIDEVIEGKDEWTDKAQDDSQRQEAIDNEIGDTLDDIDDKSSLDNVLPDVSKQPADLEKYVNEWVDDEGWTSVLDVFKPILSDGNFTPILFMVVAFINISVVLMGR